MRPRSRATPAAWPLSPEDMLARLRDGAHPRLDAHLRAVCDESRLGAGSASTDPGSPLRAAAMPTWTQPAWCGIAADLRVWALSGVEGTADPGCPAPHAAYAAVLACEYAAIHDPAHLELDSLIAPFVLLRRAQAARGPVFDAEAMLAYLHGWSARFPADAPDAESASDMVGLLTVIEAEHLGAAASAPCLAAAELSAAQLTRRLAEGRYTFRRVVPSRCRVWIAELLEALDASARTRLRDLTS